LRETNDKRNEGNSYDKIKHLVEVDDDILAVFIMVSSELKEFYIANNSNIDREYIDSIVNELDFNKGMDNQTSSGKERQLHIRSILGKLKWIVLEYENLRILKIYESDKIVFVLINSNTRLEYTIDNILGYYYEMDEIAKSLF
jgi:hypothetical protein